MRLIDILFAIAVALGVGFGSAWLAVDYWGGIGTLTSGPWVTRPTAGTADPDPYTAAILTRSGVLPLGAAEGLEFRAAADSAGNPLSGRCRYRITGPVPPARLWTLAAVDGDGRPMDNPTGRYTVDSENALREADGSVAIAVGPAAEPGNWLPVMPVEPVELIFRLYDTPLTTGLFPAAIAMPAILREGCA